MDEDGRAMTSDEGVTAVAVPPVADPTTPSSSATTMAPETPTDAPEPPAAPTEAAAADSPPPPNRFGRIRRWIHLPRTRRGIAALLLVVGMFGLTSVAGAVQLIHWTETADFCGRCHTMGPELTAHANSPHADVTCGECHVEPGLAGWVKAKVNGTRQLVEIVVGAFPRPIPPPDHDELPAAKDTCLQCHDVTKLATTRLVTRAQFTEDEENTRQFVGLLIRPGGGDFTEADRGVHWHVLQDVEYSTTLANRQKIDYVKVRGADGVDREYIAQDQVSVSSDVAPDIARVVAAGTTHRMDCLDCHNRIGHPQSNPRRGLDEAMTAGKIDTSLPYIKREGMRILEGDYPDVQAADAAADSLKVFYQNRYPLVAKAQSAQIDAAISQIKTLYRLVATPEMKVTAKTYPDNLGHMDFVGCFRCHDGAHFLVQNGTVTNKAIPSSCDTCHTFPQIGGEIANLPLGVPPDTHKDRLYVFNHAKVATSKDPGQTTCGQCHSRDYCENCHKTGAVTVTHDEMLTNHAKVTRAQGTSACAYCHQPVYCARCHTENVLGGTPTGTLGMAPVPPGPPGLSFPLQALTASR